MVEELRTEYHRHLQEIDHAVSRLIVLAEEAIAAASTALLAADDLAAEAVAARRTEIAELHTSIEEQVISQLVRQAPIASELRFLVAVLRIVPEVELSAALAGDIGRRGGMHIGNELPARVRGLVSQLFVRVQDMWRRAADAYHDRNPEVYARLEGDDEEIDELFTSLIAELASGTLRAPVLVEMALVARFLERLADHAVELGRWVVSFTTAQS
jgi:phosphate transport system protein